MAWVGGAVVVVVDGAAAMVVVGAGVVVVGAEGVEGELVFDDAGVEVAVAGEDDGTVEEELCCAALPDPVFTLGFATPRPPGTLASEPPDEAPLLEAAGTPAPEDDDPVFSAAVCNAANAD